MHSTDAVRMDNSVDPDQTTLGAVWSVSTLFVDMSVWKLKIITVMSNKIKWAATWQNQQSDCAPSKDSYQPGRPGWYESLLCT